MWKSSEIFSFNHRAVSDLIANKIPAVKIPKFGTSDEIKRFQKELLAQSGRSSSIEQVIRVTVHVPLQ